MFCTFLKSDKGIRYSFQPVGDPSFIVVPARYVVSFKLKLDEK